MAIGGGGGESPYPRQSPCLEGYPTEPPVRIIIVNVRLINVVRIYVLLFWVDSGGMNQILKTFQESRSMLDMHLDGLLWGRTTLGQAFWGGMLVGHLIWVTYIGVGCSACRGTFYLGPCSSNTVSLILLLSGHVARNEIASLLQCFNL